MIAGKIAKSCSTINTKIVRVRQDHFLFEWSYQVLNWSNNFQDNCKLGCPCEEYDCRIAEKFSVLTLSTHKTSNYPTLIRYDGGKEPNFSGLNFKITSNTEVAGSCSAILNNEFYVFGGRTSGTKRQVSPFDSLNPVIIFFI